MLSCRKIPAGPGISISWSRADAVFCHRLQKQLEHSRMKRSCHRLEKWQLLKKTWCSHNYCCCHSCASLHIYKFQKHPWPLFAVREASSFPLWGWALCKCEARGVLLIWSFFSHALILTSNVPLTLYYKDVTPRLNQDQNKTKQKTFHRFFLSVIKNRNLLLLRIISILFEKSIRDFTYWHSLFSC